MDSVRSPSPERPQHADLALSGMALLSPEASKRARRLRAWSAEARATLATRVQGVLQGWEQAYGLDSSAFEPHLGQRQIRCEPAQPSGGHAGSWTPLGPTGPWWALLGWGQETPHGLLLKALFDEASPTTPDTDRMADEVARAAWEDWKAQLQSALPAAPSADSPEAQFQPWSGALVLTLPWCGREFLLLISEASAAAILGQAEPAPVGARTPLVPTAQAITPLRVPLRVELASLDTDLGTLTSLRVGDVLRTSHALELPLLVRSSTEPGGLCNAFLGQQGAHRAVELLRQPAPRS